MRRAVITAALLFVFIIGSFAFAAHQMRAAEGRAELLNMLGRQRMLTQQIARFSPHFHQSDTNLRAERSVEFGRAIQEFERADELLAASPYLLSTDAATLTALELSDVLLELARSIHRRAPTSSDDPRVRDLAQLATGPLLESLDQATLMHQLAIEDDVDGHILLLGVLALLFAGVVVASGRLVLMPALHRIEADIAAQAVAAAQDAQRLFEASIDLLCIAGADGKFIRVSPSAEHLLGYKPEELKGRPILDFVHPDDHATTVTTTQFASGDDVYHFENRYLTKTGDVRVLRWRSRAAPESGLIYATASDVTLERKLADQLADHARELERSNQALDEFAYVASHDLRAPLRDIDNLASWLEEDAAQLLPPKSHEHLVKIRNRIDRMEKLLTDLLSYSRIGRVADATREVDFDALVTSVLELAAVPDSFNVERNISVAPFEAPAAQLERVVLNLVANVVKHHDSDRGTITISARDEDDHVVFSVTDDGPGIDPMYHERVFDLFRTLKRRDDVEGSGMGLAIIRKIVEFHHGSVTLSSTPGEGTTFEVRWPRTVAPSAVHDQSTGVTHG